MTFTIEYGVPRRTARFSCYADAFAFACSQAAAHSAGDVEVVANGKGGGIVAQFDRFGHLTPEFAHVSAT